MARDSALEGFTVTAEELADLLEVDRRTVYRHAAEEGMPRIGRGRYPLADCVRYYMRRLKTEAELKQTDPGIDDDRRRLVVAQAEKCELENRQTRGSLIEAPMVAAVLNQVAAIIATQLDALGPRTANDLARMSDPAAIQLHLRGEGAAIRSAISGALEAFATTIRDGEYHRAAAGQDGGRMGGLVPDAAAGQPGAGEMAH